MIQSNADNQHLVDEMTVWSFGGARLQTSEPAR
jgi:hypothetical protein